VRPCGLATCHTADAFCPADLLLAACCHLLCLCCLKAAGWSSWNVFGGGVTAEAVMGMADVMVEKGLDKLGYVYVGIDCGWDLRERAPNGDLQPNPKKFPKGIKHVADYVNSLGDGLLKLGIYSEHDKADCCGGPGMKGFEDQDARFYKENGIAYLKVDSCAGHDLNATTMYQDYANIRDALNRSGNPVYLNICPTTKMADTFPSLHPPCNAWGDDVYSSLAFQNAGLNVRDLANSALVEYCNNANNWGVLLGMIDAQRVLANDSWSAPGSWIDADMLTVGCNDNRIRGTPCDHGTPLTVTEEYTQFSLWCIFASNLMLGSDLRNISNTTLDIIGNREALAVNRDPLGAHGRLVHDSAPPSPKPLACHPGGSDKYTLHRANMTVADATRWCRNTSKCAGFCSNSSGYPAACAAGGGGGGAPSSAVLDIRFVDSWAVHRLGSDTSWSSWVPAPSPPPGPRLQVFAKPMHDGSRAVRSQLLCHRCCYSLCVCVCVRVRLNYAPLIH
jgi:hypothetical protein